eukprot:scaffold157653_cov16-Prasinocladus_malaysianus.AAC.1
MRGMPIIMSYLIGIKAKISPIGVLHEAQYMKLVHIHIVQLIRPEATQRIAGLTALFTCQVVSEGPRGASMKKSFRFHACLGPENRQPDVMTMCNVPALLDAAMAGVCLAATCLATITVGS